MNVRRRIVLGFAAAGVGVCLWALGGFFRTIVTNALPWQAASDFTPEHYRAVGQAYSQGFTVGFFFCFFLTVIAFNVGGWYESRRRTQERATQATGCARW